MSDTPTNEELVAGLVRLLTVEKRAVDGYVGRPQQDGIGRVFGGQVLAQALQAARRAGRDIGSLAALRPFERAHRRATLPLYLGTNAIVGLFTDERPLARLARRGVLDLARRAPGLGHAIRAAITRELTGDAHQPSLRP